MKKIKNGMYTIVSFLLLLLLWQYASTKSNPLFVPKPLDVWNSFITVLEDGTLFLHIWYTFRRIAIATCMSGAVALPLGLLIHNSRIAKVTVYPIISLFRYVPVTAFYPLLIMWAGIDESMKISFYFIATFVYMMPTVVLSLDEVREELIDTGLTMGMSKIQLITKIQMPATMPSILNSFVMMFGIGFTYCAVVETINAKYGLGYIIHQSTARGRTELVFMAILVIMALSFIIDNVARFIIRKIFKWRYINERN